MVVRVIDAPQDVVEVLPTIEVESVKPPTVNPVATPTSGQQTISMSPQVAATIMRTDSTEVAEIIVKGTIFRDWESVVVRDVEGETSDYCMFTCSEGSPLSKNWAGIQIRPGDDCEVKLAGETVITGKVETRQVAYTAQAHGIQIIGHAYTRATAYGSVVHKTREFKKKNYKQIADEILKPFGIKFKPIGQLSQKVFERLHVPHGETAWSVLERLARLRNITLGSHPDGSMTGRTEWPSTGDSLIEGQNILEGREVMTMLSNGGNTAPNHTVGQRPGNDDEWASKVAQQFHTDTFTNLGYFGGTSGWYNPIITATEHPGDKDDHKTRSETEQNQRAYEELKVDIVVQGWLRPSGRLWKAGEKVHVKSPMLIVDEDLKIVQVEFSQDSKSGTRTTLSMVRETLEHKYSANPGGQ